MEVCKSRFAFFHIFEYFKAEHSVRQRHSVIGRNHNFSLSVSRELSRRKMVLFIMWLNAE